MAIETDSFKSYLGTLPQQSDVDSIMAKDANGNPIWIKKADLAQVAAELIPVATTEKKGFMPANFYANSTINLTMGCTYKIASTTSTYIYMEFIVNSYTQGFIGEARIRIAKSSKGEPVVKTALSVNGRFQVFYTFNDGETEIFIKVIKSNLLIAPSMDFRLNPYELNLKKEECELPNAAKEFDYE